MKTGIITFHFVNNFGGALQAYALRRFASEGFCADTELIDYRHWFIRLTDAARMFPITPRARYYGPWFRSFKKMISRRKKFAGFIKKGRLSRRADFPFQLRKISSEYDLAICGSDQIWNPMLTCGVASPYFLRFAPTDCRRISYAASVGGMMGSRDKMLRYIRDLDAVSIRENVDWIESADQLSVEHHIDPTFLLTPGEWREIAVEPESDEQYILAYFMQMDDSAYDVLEKLKAETGLKVYDISRYGYQPACVDRCLVDVGPEDFVGLFSSAQRICTNSFHGLAFSLIFSKPVDFVPMHRFGGRVEKLCEVLQLKKTPVDGGTYYHIDYNTDEKDAILERERERSRDYFKRAIGAIHDKHH